MIELSMDCILGLPSVGLEERSKLPKIPAVYFVVDSSNELLYIGRGANLSGRWSGHQKIQDLQGKVGVRIHWLGLSDCELLPRFESSLIARYRPPLNVLLPNPVNVLGDTAIAHLRKRLGLRTVDIASALGIAESTVRAWETGRSSPHLPITQVPVLLSIYQVTLDEMIKAVEKTREQVSKATAA